MGRGVQWRHIRGQPNTLRCVAGLGRAWGKLSGGSFILSWDLQDLGKWSRHEQECSKLRWLHRQRLTGEELGPPKELKETQSGMFSTFHTTALQNLLSFVKLCQHMPHAWFGRWAGDLTWESSPLLSREVAMALHLEGAQGQVWTRLLSPLPAVSLVFPRCFISLQNT